MPNNRPDVIELLENEKRYHSEQLKRIDIALAALRGETIPIEQDNQGAKRSESIPWSSAVEKVFKDNDKWLSIEDVQKKLSENGILEVSGSRKRSILYSTLMRKVKSQFLERNKDGCYRKRETSNRGLFDREGETL
jgi:hypothetical protein